jgi:hypothetical protein
MSGADPRRSRLVRAAPVLAEAVALSLLVRLQIALLPAARLLGPDTPLPPVEPRAGSDAQVARLEWAVAACLAAPRCGPGAWSARWCFGACSGGGACRASS